jgi:hypothetical protein
MTALYVTGSGQPMNGRGGTCPRVGVGERMSFGGGPGADLTFPGAGIPDVVGHLTALPVCWMVENAGSTPIVVENQHGNGHDFVKVTERRSAPVPFEVARVLILGPVGVVSFDVRTVLYSGGPDPARPAVVPPALLDETRKYFRVLVALCEPALRYRATFLIPTTTQIVDRLRRLPSCREITTAAVEFHLNYLQTHKLAAHVQAYSKIHGSGALPGAHRRAELVDFALRFDLVAPRHLALLDRTSASAPTGRARPAGRRRRPPRPRPRG